MKVELTFSASETAKWKSHQMAMLWFLTKLNTTLPRDPATVLLGGHQNELTRSHKILHTNAYSSFSVTPEGWKEPKCPSER